MKWLLLVCLIIISVLVLVACGGGYRTTTATTIPPTTTTTTTTPASQTFGQLATAGQAVYTAKCSPCHGNQGQGVTAPALWGANANLKKYNTAQGLLQFIVANMPFSAPGSLAHQDYLNVLSFLLIQSSDVSSVTAFDESGLGSISLK